MIDTIFSPSQAGAPLSEELFTACEADPDRLRRDYMAAKNTIETDPDFRSAFLEFWEARTIGAALPNAEVAIDLLRTRAVFQCKENWDPTSSTPRPTDNMAAALEAQFGGRMDTPAAEMALAIQAFWTDGQFRQADRIAQAAAEPQLRKFVRDDWNGAKTVRPLPAEVQEPPIDTSLDFVVQTREPLSAQVLCACDGIYFEVFALMLASSIQHASFFDGLHLHVVNPGQRFDEICGKLETLTAEIGRSLNITAETANITDRASLACNRFLTLRKLQETSGQDYFVIDADAYFRPAPDGSPLTMPRDKIGLSRSEIPGRGGYLPWRFVAATAGWFPCTDVSKAYLSHTATYLTQAWHGPGSNWWIDQTALAYGYFALSEADRSDAMVPLTHFWRNWAATGEAYKLEQIAKHPDVAQLMAQGKAWNEALRTLQTAR